MLFEIKDLCKTYNNRDVLNIPEFCFEEGGIYSLLGPNGSGKTTLLEILSLLDLPSSGKIYYRDKYIDFQRDDLTALRREIVMVQQNPILFTTTVFKNLDFGLKVRGLPKKKRKEAVEESLDLVGMTPFIDTAAHKLSGGETQRVAIARALVLSPRVMLLDEPTASVDVENRFGIEQIITEINSKKGISVIFTSHDLFQASQLTRNVISLYEGRLTSSLSENIFRGKIEEEEDGRQSCVILGRIRFFTKSERAGEVKLSLDPRKIEILADDKALKEENCFDGKILQMTLEHDQVRVVADIGILLNIILPEDEVRAKDNLSIGNKIRILFTQEAVKIF